MIGVKVYKNILSGVLGIATHATLYVPIRGSRMVVARVTSLNLQNVSVSSPIFEWSGRAGGAEASVPGQGFQILGTTPLSLANGPATWAMALVTGASQVGAAMPSYLDWARAKFTLAAQVDQASVDLEVWYDGDANAALFRQLGAWNYTPV